MEQAGLMITCTRCGKQIFLKAKPADEVIGFGVYEKKPEGWIRLHRDGSIAPESSAGHFPAPKPIFFDLCPECARDFVEKFGKFDEEITIKIPSSGHIAKLHAEHEAEDEIEDEEEAPDDITPDEITGVLGQLIDEVDMPLDILEEVSDLYKRAANLL